MEFREAAAAVAVLADELRAEIYTLIRAHARPMSRDDVADRVGISRGLAAFHLDKLVSAGWLTASYARPPGRSGPGAGRTSKYYRPSQMQVELSLPRRRYDVVAEILIAALKQVQPSEEPREAACRVARLKGQQVGEQARRARELRPPGAERALSVCKDILAEWGFEPREDDAGGITLSNCPFRAVAQDTPDIVCALNQSLMDGVLRGLGNKTVEAVAVNRPDECCVYLRAP